MYDMFECLPAMSYLFSICIIITKNSMKGNRNFDVVMNKTLVHDTLLQRQHQTASYNSLQWSLTYPDTSVPKLTVRITE